MESAGSSSAAALGIEETGRAPSFQPFRTSFLTVDDFLPLADAQAMRGHFEQHFDNPQAHRPDTHQIWNYWYVPGLYTYLRTVPEKLMPHEMAQRFHSALLSWAEERLGLGYVTWPNLSLYVDGCLQSLHNDSLNGRFGYVFSLTPNTRRSRGGETMLVREGDLFRSNLTQAQAGAGLYDLVESRFNRLTVFDDRIPHGVQRVEGAMDPLDGRLVLHGHISESKAIVNGPLPAEAVWAAARPALDPVLATHGAASCHGPLSARVRIAADGSVSEVQLLIDRVARRDGSDVRPLVDGVLDALQGVRFPAAEAGTEAALPIMFGGPLPWMVKQQETRLGPVQAKPQPKPEPEPEPAPEAADNPRAAMGAAVRARLLATKGVAKIPKDRIEAFVVPDFLTIEECEGLMRRIDEGKFPSGLMSYTPDPEFRTSETCNLSAADPLVASIEDRINSLIGIDPHHGETVQGQRYAVGQQFKPHHDFFHEGEVYWESTQKNGGQRTWTVMAFLNKPEAGGQTQFPQAGLRITPAPGYLLIWNNMGVDGEPNRNSLHQGLPVEAGVKYVITKWYRERPWAVPTAG